MGLTICPGCRQNVADRAKRCPACGWDVAAQRDREANHSLRWFNRICCLVAAAAIVWAKRNYEMELLPYAQQLLVVFLVSALAAYVLVKCVMFRSQRKLWLAASGLGMLATAGVYAGRAAVAHGDLPMATLTVSALTSRGTAATKPTTEPAAAAARAGKAAAIPLSVTDAYDPLLRFARDAFARLNQQPDAVHSELEAAGVPRLLSPATLADYKKLAAGRTRIKRLYDRLDAYEAQVRKTVASVPTKVQTADAPAAAKTRFLASFRPAADEAQRGVTNFIAAERQSLAQVDALLAFAQAKAGRFTVQGNKVTFADAQDNATYATLRRDLTTSAARQDQALRNFRGLGEVAMHKVITSLDSQTAAAE